MNYKKTLSGLICILLMGLNTLSANDDPCNATELNITASCSFTTFSNATATNTVSVPDPGCAGYGGGDIWFRFTMPNYGYHTTIELGAGSMTDAGIAIYSGTDCSNLTLVSCDDNSGTGNMPLISVEDGCGFEFAGETFWVRVWENGNDNNGTFDICAYTTPANVPGGVLACGSNLIAGNACCDALLLGADLDGYCGNTGNYTDIPDEIPNFCAFIDNNAWLAFIASETSVDIGIVSSGCTDLNGIQVAILETSDCTNFNVLSNCWNPGMEASGNLVASGLTVGETYYIMVDGWAGDNCDYTLSIVSGVETVSITVDDDEICQGESTQLHVDVIGAGPYTYNWSPAATLDDPTSPNPIATPTGDTDYTVTITGITNNIHTASVTVYPAGPTLTSLTGASSVCENSTNVLYVATATNASTFNWTLSGSASLVSGSGTDSLYVNFGLAGGSICVEAVNNCGLSLSECITISITGQPIISANDPPTACAPDPFDFNTIVVNNTGSGGGLTTYYDNLIDATVGTNDIFPPMTTTSGRYYVRMESGPDCYSLDSVDVLIENPGLVIVDPGARCSPNFVDLDNVVVNEVNGYPGGTKTYFTDSLEAVNNTNVLISTVVTNGGVYWVRYETPEGCFVVGAINVVIDDTPDITVVNPAALCPGGFIDLDTITLIDANNTTYTKTFHTNFTFADLDILPLSSTVVSSMSQSYFVRAEVTDDCYQVIEIVITQGVTPDAAISGGGTFCQGENAEITFILNGSGPFDVVYTDGLNTYTLNGISNNHIASHTVFADSTFSLISVNDINGCSGNLFGSNVDIVAAPAPIGVISGDANICTSGNVDIDFSFTGSGPFDIEYSDGTNTFPLTGLSNNHTISLNVNSNTTFTLVSLSDGGACPGTISGSATIDVTDPLTINNITESCNAAFTMYIVSFEILNGDASSYSVSGDPGTLVGNLFTSDPIISGSSYSFSVSDNSTCLSEVVTGSLNCSCSTDAGTMDLNIIEVCEDETVIASFVTGSNTLNPGDLFRYVLHDNAGSALGSPFGFSTLPEFTIQPGMVLGNTYYISPIAGPDDGMGQVDFSHNCFSISPGTPVVFYELPTAIITGDASICSGSTTDLVFNFTTGVGPYEVTIEDQDANQTIIPGLNDGDVFTIAPNTASSYIIVNVIGGPASCSGTGSGSAVITVNEAPQINNVQFICNNINTQYQVSFEISGGEPSTYNVGGNSGILDNTINTFLSDPIDNGIAYSFQVDDSNFCGPVNVEGSFICDCTSNAGEMELTIIEVCEDEMASAQHISTNLNLDDNDVLGFILYDESSPLPGSIMLMSSTANFNYDASLNYGETYLISAVVADDSGTGFPVLDASVDPCLSISNGQPIVFYEEPEISISGNVSICEGDSTDLIFSITGTGPFNVTYNNGIEDLILLGISNGHIIRISPTVTTNYSLVSVELASSPFCEGLIDITNNEVTIDVIEMPVVSNVVSLCNQLGTNYTVSFEITGGNSLQYNVNGDPGTLSGNTFLSDPLPGGSTYNFQIDDGSGCPPIILTGTEFCNCTPDIKPSISLDQAISCFGESDGTLNVTNVNGVEPFSFVWSSGATETTAENLAVGWQTVTMTDGNNCLSVDSFFITEPIAIQAELDVTPLICYGDDEGEITILNIQGGVGDYSYSLDYNTTFIEDTFYDLPAGTYEATISDAEGCTWSDTITILEPEELIIDVGEDVVLEIGDSILIDPYISLPIDSFSWVSESQIECFNCLEQMLHPMESNSYMLFASTAEGCIGMDEINISVENEHPFFIPNIFTPNGDGENDVLRIYSGGGITLIHEFRIFDRWGALVYEVKDRTPEAEGFGWDGKIKGEDLAQGVYVYFLKVEYLDGTSELITGDVTILR